MSQEQTPLLAHRILGNKRDSRRFVNAVNKQELFLEYTLNQKLISKYSINEN